MRFFLPSDRWGTNCVDLRKKKQNSLVPVSARRSHWCHKVSCLSSSRYRTCCSDNSRPRNPHTKSRNHPDLKLRSTQSPLQLRLGDGSAAPLQNCFVIPVRLGPCFEGARKRAVCRCFVLKCARGTDESRTSFLLSSSSTCNVRGQFGEWSPYSQIPDGALVNKWSQNLLFSLKVPKNAPSFNMPFVKYWRGWGHWQQMRSKRESSPPHDSQPPTKISTSRYVIVLLFSPGCKFALIFDKWRMEMKRRTVSGNIRILGQPPSRNSCPSSFALKILRSLVAWFQKFASEISRYIRICWMHGCCPREEGLLRDVQATSGFQWFLFRGWASSFLAVFGPLLLKLDDF